MNTIRRTPLLVVWMLVLVGLGSAVGCGGEKPESPPSQEPDASLQDAVAEVEGALRDEDVNRRLAVVWTLPERRDIDASTKVRLLLDALDSEISLPTQATLQYGTYLSSSEYLRFVYTRSLGNSEPAGLEVLREALRGESGELRARAALALGYAGDPAVVPDLLELLRSSEIGDIRSDAAYLLGELGGEEAIPDLRRAIAADTYWVTVKNLSGTTSGFYPVRAEAARSLKQLGVSVELTEDGEYRVSER
jgi:HEAT repeat protein